MRAGWDPDRVLTELAAGRKARCSDIGMRIDRRGTWYHQGRRIPRIELVRLFSTALRRGPDGRYWLLTPFEEIPVEVEDAPFLAVELDRDGEGRGQRLRFRTNLDAWYPLDPEHPLRLGRPPGQSVRIPYLALEHGLEARLDRPVYYELVELAEQGADGRYGVWSHDRFFPLEEANGG